MTSPTPELPARTPPRTPEEHAAIRRRALPVALAGVICGILGILLPLAHPVTALTPPSLLAMNLWFSALLIGVGIFLYAKGTPGTRAATVSCLIAILLGIAGSLLYTKQAVDSRMLRENLEFNNIKAIAVAARQYAASHDGRYPADLLVLLEEKLLQPSNLQSPYGKNDKFFDNFEAAKSLLLPAKRNELLDAVNTASDYDYTGADLKSVPEAQAPDILVAGSRNVVLRISEAVSFADGNARFITLEEVQTVMNACNEARRKIGLPDLAPPTVLKEALTEKPGTATAPK